MEFLKQGFSFLEYKEKKQIILLLFLSLIGSFLELFGIGLILPFLNAIISKKTYEDIEFFKHFKDNAITDSLNIEIFFLILILTIFLLKNIYLFFQLKIQSKIIYAISSKLSSRIFNGYLKMNFIDFKSKNSSDLIRNIHAEINTYVTGFLNSFIISCIEIILLLSILIFLFYIDFKLTLISLGLLLVFSSTIYFFLKNKILLLGKLKQNFEASRLKCLFHGFGAIKEIKLTNKENFFVNDFEKENSQCLSATRQFLILSNTPRLLLEFFGILIIVSIFYILLDRSENPETLLPKAGMFFIAFFRMMPSANKILIAFQSINFSRASVRLLNNEFKFINKLKPKKKLNDIKKISLNNQIEIKNLNFFYDFEKNGFSLSNINLKIKKGELIGICGESGSGKSTLVDLILGLYEPNSGKILYDDININKDVQAWQKIIGYVPQSIFLIDDSIKNNIALGTREKDIDLLRLNYAIIKSKLEEFVKFSKNDIDTFVGEKGAKISGGQLQRIGIARALYKDSEIIIFDEATSALDEETEDEILKTIFELKRKVTVILISHNKRVLELCDRIINIHQGKIISDES